MKKILTKDDEKNRYLKIREMVKTYPNDMELGGKVRALFWKSKPHYPSKEMRDSWNESQS